MTDSADFADAAEIGGAAAPFGAPVSATAPPQTGLRGSVGLGKTFQFVQRARAVLGADPDARVFAFAPDHDLMTELAGRLRDGLGPGIEVEVWQGANRPDPAAPPGAPRQMCQRADDARVVREAGGELADLCGTAARGFCRHHPNAPGGDCGYIRQAEKAKSGTVSVWVMPHAMLGRGAPPPLRRYVTGPDGKLVRVPAADLTLIDEQFWPSMLGGFDDAP